MGSPWGRGGYRIWAHAGTTYGTTCGTKSEPGNGTALGSERPPHVGPRRYHVRYHVRYQIRAGKWIRSNVRVQKL